MSIRRESAPARICLAGAAMIVLLALMALPITAGQTASSTSAGTTSVPLQSDDTSCGLHPSQSNATVVTSPAGSAVTITIGEPSWDEACGQAGPAGVALPAYEVFPVTINAGPDVTFALETGNVSVSPQQIAEGVANGTLWTGFSPAIVTTDSSGVASSNLTLTGAVMPFTPNPIANVSLPITATSPNGLQATTGIPIEFLGVEGGLPNLHVLSSPGPLLFSGTLQQSTGNPLSYEYVIAYAPSAGSPSAPVNVSLSIAGSWNGGESGPMPAGLQVSLQQPTFQLLPGHVAYFWVDETNNLSASDNYTLAVQEMIGSGTYLEPMSLSITPATTGSLIMPTGSPASNGPLTFGRSSGVVFAVIGAVAASAIITSALLLRRTKAPKLEQ